MVLRERIELSTSPLPMECSTTELPQRRKGMGACAHRSVSRRWIDGWPAQINRQLRVLRAGAGPARWASVTCIQPCGHARLASARRHCVCAGRRARLPAPQPRAGGASEQPGRAPPRRLLVTTSLSRAVAARDPDARRRFGRCRRSWRGARSGGRRGRDRRRGSEHARGCGPFPARSDHCRDRP